MRLHDRRASAVSQLAFVASQEHELQEQSCDSPVTDAPFHAIGVMRLHIIEQNF